MPSIFEMILHVPQSGVGDVLAALPRGAAIKSVKQFKSETPKSPITQEDGGGPVGALRAFFANSEGTVDIQTVKKALSDAGFSHQASSARLGTLIKEKFIKRVGKGLYTRR